MREKAWDWYGSTALTRVSPGGGVLVINTRWHDDDLAGRILRANAEARDEIMEKIGFCEEIDDEAGVAKAREELTSLEKWDVVSFTALAESVEYLSDAGNLVYDAGPKGNYRLLRREGEALHPERYDRAALLRTKNILQPRHWSALYQQNPTPDEGSFFRRDMFRYNATSPDHRLMHTYAAWDLAIGQRQTNDWTVGIVGAVDWNGDVHILDMVRARMDTHEIAKAVIETALKYRCVLTGIERGQLELAVRPEIEKQLRELKTTIPLADGPDALIPVTDKVVRARPMQGMLQRGRVWLPNDQPWSETLVAEMLRFPLGLNDDIVDSMSWLGRMVVNAGLPKKPAERFGQENARSWKEKLRDMRRGKDFMAA